MPRQLPRKVGDTFDEDGETWIVTAVSLDTMEVTRIPDGESADGLNAEWRARDQPQRTLPRTSSVLW